VSLRISTAAIILMIFFWVKSPCAFVGRSQRFGDVCCLHLQDWSKFLLFCHVFPYILTYISSHYIFQHFNRKSAQISTKIFETSQLKCRLA
jgi:hypothetical protein